MDFLAVGFGISRHDKACFDLLSFRRARMRRKDLCQGAPGRVTGCSNDKNHLIGRIILRKKSRSVFLQVWVHPLTGNDDRRRWMIRPRQALPTSANKIQELESLTQRPQTLKSEKNRKDDERGHRMDSGFNRDFMFALSFRRGVNGRVLSLAPMHFADLIARSRWQI